MDLTLARFVHALRSAELPVSPAETLDGFEVVQRIGIADPRLLEHALALTLAKTREEKERFARCFDTFFHQLAFQQSPKQSILKRVDTDGLLTSVATLENEDLTSLVEAVVEQEKSSLALRVQQEATRLNVSGMRSLRDKAAAIEDLLRALGIDELGKLLDDPAQTNAEYFPAIRYLRQYVQEQVRDYVDAQYQLHVDATGKRTLVEAALKGHFAQLPPDYYHEVDRVVAKLADRLAQQHRRKRRRAHRGALDLKHTLRDNIAYDGALFKLRWRRKRLQKSAVYVVCDVSNSVAAVARFLLLFLHGLTDVLPELRAFAFSNRLGEITETLRKKDLEHAVEEALFDWGKGSTDYGRALVDFRELTHRDLDHRSTVIFLGDARGNYFEPRVDILREISARVKQVSWLNPETRARWGGGDSDMASFAAHCLRVDVCRDLREIERFADRLVSATR
jgi:uncharacterized protein with von Willebrand factor type A (vWA) domain